MNGGRLFDLFPLATKQLNKSVDDDHTSVKMFHLLLKRMTQRRRSYIRHFVIKDVM